MGQCVPKLYWEQGIIELMIGAFKVWVGFFAKPKVESESSVNSVIIKKILKQIGTAPPPPNLFHVQKKRYFFWNCLPKCVRSRLIG